MTNEMTVNRAYDICNEFAETMNCEDDRDIASVLIKIAEREKALVYLAEMNEIDLDSRAVALLPHIANLLSTVADLLNLSDKYDSLGI